jgi:hypothetical protein
LRDVRVNFSDPTRRCINRANLAEGCGRLGEVEMARFIQISMGSASELQNHLRLAHDLGYFTPADYRSASEDLTSVRQMLTAFLQSLRGVRKSREIVPPSLAKSE